MVHFLKDVIVDKFSKTMKSMNIFLLSGAFRFLSIGLLVFSFSNLARAEWVEAGAKAIVNQSMKEAEMIELLSELPRLHRYLTSLHLVKKEELKIRRVGISRSKLSWKNEASCKKDGFSSEKSMSFAEYGVGRQVWQVQIEKLPSNPCISKPVKAQIKTFQRK